MRQSRVLLALACAFLASPLFAADPVVTPGQSALQELRTFATTARVLHVGAHPDDENTQLIAYFSRGRGYDTAYLSVTRGDGGQNLLGPQFDEKLGVARTQELLAARRIDGGRQFFTRAIDFGFSKNPEETLSIWNHDEVLGDVVRVIRTFRPDVIITRFPIPPGSGGHGHHTASAMLAVEAFKLAGDPNAYPEQLKEGLTPWQPKRVLWNKSSFFRPSAIDNKPTIKVDIGGTDPVTGESFSSLATRSRRMHKTQGLGEVGTWNLTTESFVLLAGEPAEHDIMDGVDPTWNRIPGGDVIANLANTAVQQFDVAHPEKSVDALLNVRRKLAPLGDSELMRTKRAELDRVIERCAGIEVSSTADRPDVVPGEKLPVTLSLKSAVAVRWVDAKALDSHVAVDAAVSGGVPASRPATLSLPRTARLTEPYWLREPHEVGMYAVDDPKLIGRPESPADLPVVYTVALGDQTLTIHDRVRYASVGGTSRPDTVGGTSRHDTVGGASRPDTVGGALRPDSEAPAARDVVIVRPVALTFDSRVEILRPGASRTVTVEIRGRRPNLKGEVTLQLPSGWQSSGPKSYTLREPGDVAKLTFDVQAPAGATTGSARAHTVIDGVDCHRSEAAVAYAHIPPQILQPQAAVKLVSVDVATRGHEIGYVTGAGDDVPQALQQLGYAVRELHAADFKPETLSKFDAIVIGVRAFDTREDLRASTSALFQYVENGGTVVAQYNRPPPNKPVTLAPYRLQVSNNRVTDEHAAVTFLAADHPALNVPNKITSADFEGWVQERGIYFPSEWDEHFVPVLAMGDPGEPQQKGSLLIAPYGKGHYVYTGLVFFRELPAGVPGAYRLFANLVSLGK